MLVRIMPAALFALAVLTSLSFTARGQSESKPDSELRTYKDWSVRCVKPGNGAENCILFQRIALNNGQLFAIVRIQKDVVRTEEEGPVDIAVVTTPLGVHLPSGVSLGFDDSEPVEMEFEHCDQRGCHSGTILTEKLRTTLVQGEAGNLSFKTIGGQTLAPSLSLQGFADGYNSF